MHGSSEEVAPERRAAARRLAWVLGVVALGFYTVFILMHWGE